MRHVGTHLSGRFQCCASATSKALSSSHLHMCRIATRCSGSKPYMHACTESTLHAYMCMPQVQLRRPLYEQSRTSSAHLREVRQELLPQALSRPRQPWCGAFAPSRIRAARQPRSRWPSKLLQLCKLRQSDRSGGDAVRQDGGVRVGLEDGVSVLCSQCTQIIMPRRPRLRFSARSSGVSAQKGQLLCTVECISGCKPNPDEVSHHLLEP